MNLRDEAGLFLDEVRSTLIDALPLASEGDIETEAWLNADTNIVVGEFDAPVIHGAGQLESEVDSQDYSQLFRVIVRYELTSDSTGKFLAVERSKFELRVATSPGIRFEYERGYTSAPCAHIHYSGVTGLLSPALMQNFQGQSGNPRKKGRLEELHLPVGGRRFRPSLEEFLYFVIAECGFRGKPGWEPALLRRRQEWLFKQTAAAARDYPEAAAKSLEELGFSVTPPAGSEEVVGEPWDVDTPLRRDEERRAAQVEIDAIVALSLGVTADELCMIFRTQFPVMQRYDQEDRFDANGRKVPKDVMKLEAKLHDGEELSVADRTWVHPQSGVEYVYEYLFRQLDREADMREAYARFAGVVGS